MNKGRGLSFGFYLALSYALLVMIGLVSTGLYWFAQQEDSAEDALLLQLREHARLLSLVSYEDLPNQSFQLPGPTTALNNNLRVVLVTPNMKIQRISDLDLTEEQRGLVLKLAPQVLLGQTYSMEDHLGPGDSREVLYAGAPIYTSDGRVSGAICLVLALDDFQRTINGLRWGMIGFSALLAGLSLIMGIILAKIFTRPLDQAGKMAAQIAGGDNSTRLPRRGPRELVHLVDQMNEMAEKLEQQEHTRQEVLAGVTHELARPLGALRLGIDTLLNGALKEPELAEDLLGEIRRTLQQMEAQVEDFAISARPNENQLQITLTPLELEPFLHGVYARFWPLAESRNIRFSSDISCDLSPVLANEVRLNQILGNLMDNALKFTSPGGEIILSAHENDHLVELAVQDSGPGVPSEELPYLFKPFKRGVNSKFIHDGMGLGLSIVQRLVQAHNGQVKVENLPGGGFCVRILLPAADHV